MIWYQLSHTPNILFIFFQMQEQTVAQIFTWITVTVEKESENVETSMLF